MGSRAKLCRAYNMVGEQEVRGTNTSVTTNFPLDLVSATGSAHKSSIVFVNLEESHRSVVVAGVAKRVLLLDVVVAWNLAMTLFCGRVLTDHPAYDDAFPNLLLNILRL